MSTDTITATPAPQERESSRWRDRVAPRLRALRLTRTTILLALLVMLGVSAYLRTLEIDFKYWIDEGISVGIASHHLSAISGLMRQDGSPPLYYLLLHVWMSVFGRTEAATHALSLLFALLAIPAALWAGTRMFGRRVGVIAALIVAFLPYLTTYAQETRMYALVAFFSVFLATGFVQAFVFRRRRWLPVFSIALTLILYTHNWGLFSGLACGLAFLWCVWRTPTSRRALWIDGAIGFGVVVVLFLPWIPTVLFQSRHTGAPWNLPPVLWSISQGLYFIVGGRGGAMLMLLGGGAGLWTLVQHRRGTLSAAPGSSGIAVTDAAVPPSAGLPPTTALRRAAECLLVLSLGTMLIAFLYSKHSPAFTNRYFAVTIGPFALLFALGLTRGGRLAAIALALATLFWIIDPIPHSAWSKSNVEAVAAELRPELRSDSLVLSTQPEEVPTLAYYLPGITHFGTPIGPVADPGVVDWRDILHKFERSSVHTVLGPMITKMHPGQRVMLVTVTNFQTAPLYLKLIVRASERWAYFFKHTSMLKRLGSSGDKYWVAGVRVEASVWQRT
jgi:hypothetical protein